MSIPVTVIGGYLGAGKTTLINRVLAHQGDLTGLGIVVNDFGDVNIDETLIDAEAPIIGVSNGCVCCRVQDDLATSFDQLHALGITHVLFEASGIASPAKLATRTRFPGFHPRGVFVVVDGQQFDAQCADKYIGQLVQQQVKEANAIIINKQDHVGLRARLPEHTSLICADDPQLLTLLSDASAAQDLINPISEATTEFVSVTLHQQWPENTNALDQRLRALPSWVSRVKGYAQTENGRILVQKAGQDIQFSEAMRSAPNQLVFIAPAWRPNLSLKDQLAGWSAWRSDH